MAAPLHSGGEAFFSHPSEWPPGYVCAQALMADDALWKSYPRNTTKVGKILTKNTNRQRGYVGGRISLSNIAVADAPWRDKQTKTRLFPFA